MKPVSKSEVYTIILGTVLMAGMLLAFAIRTFSHLHKPQPGEPITSEMYQTLLQAVSTICFKALPVFAGFLLFLAFFVWKMHKRGVPPH